eukprot:SAG22_NODE_1924_length_3307_cov_1.297693_2_plen_127_part_00
MLKSWVAKHSPTLSLDDVCIDGSAVLLAYGLRPARDLDVIVADRPIEVAKGALPAWMHDARIGDHNKYFSRDDRNDIIYNPERHFVLHGVKWMALEEVKRMKLARDEADFAKDIIDVINVDALFLS